jgi:hypothetical protein
VAPATGVPGGTVSFKDGATTLGSATLVNGSATFTTSGLAAGSHSLSAVYGGSANFAASTSAAVTQTVNLANTTTSLSSTPNPSTVGQTVTLTATVRPVAPGTGVPGGTVSFKDGATTLGSATLVNGSATFNTSALVAGSHSLTAVYGGSATFAGSTSAVVTQTVSAGGPDTVTITGATLVRSTGALSVDGSNTKIPGDGFAKTVEVHNGGITAGACAGALIGTTSVNATGKWKFRGTTTLGPTTICVKSAGGGVASKAVTQR